MADNFTEAPYSANATWVHQPTGAWYQFTVRAATWAELRARLKEQVADFQEMGFISRARAESSEPAYLASAAPAQQAQPSAGPSQSVSEDNNVCELIENAKPVVFNDRWSWKVLCDKSKYPVYISNNLFDEHEWMVGNERATPTGPFSQGAEIPLKGKKARYETQEGKTYPYRIVEILG